MKELISIQSELNAPKTLRNNFWNYNYRSAETILEAVKPLLKKYECVLLLSDEIVNEWRFYIKATATLINKEWKEITVTWYAREEETKKGMDWSQITWASSSYARKYALNWLFAIDDAKDSDATNTHEEASKAKYTKKDFEELARNFNEGGIDVARQYLKEQQEELNVPQDKVKKLAEVYRESQFITQEDIDLCWKWTAEDAKKMAMWN